MDISQWLVLIWFGVCIIALVVFYVPPTKEELEEMERQARKDDQWK